MAHLDFNTNVKAKSPKFNYGLVFHLNKVNYLHYNHQEIDMKEHVLKGYHCLERPPTTQITVQQ